MPIQLHPCRVCGTVGVHRGKKGSRCTAIKPNGKRCNAKEWWKPLKDKNK